MCKARISLKCESYADGKTAATHKATTFKEWVPIATVLTAARSSGSSGRLGHISKQGSSMF